MLAILTLMACQDDTRVQLYFTGGLALALLLIGYLRQKALADRA